MLEKNPRNIHIAIAVFIGIFLFAGGYQIGSRNDSSSYDYPVSGVINAENPLVATGSTVVDLPEFRMCVDAKGAEVPCLIDRSEVVTQKDDPADFLQFWKVWNVINERYVPTKHAAVSNQEKVWGSIAGLADSLGDPYTYFLMPQEKTLFEQEVSGAFGGVGMQIGLKDGIVTVIAPLKGSPAEKAGILKGDKVYRIDGATTTEMSLDKALYLIRGEIGKAVNLTIYRDDLENPLEISVVRDVIQIPTIDTEIKDDVFVIHLYGFPATGADLFKNALKEFVDSGADKLVLDLRGNPGGYLEVAVDMASWFLPEGKVIVREEAKGGGGQVFRSKGYNVFKDNFHFVILVDGGSASAAEILAGALEQQGIATLVGTKTFGKGSVQELIPITPDTSLKVTVARWITPNGTNLSAGGLEPDVIVEITQEQIEAGEDPQLDKAIELIRSGKFPAQQEANLMTANE